MDTIFNEKQIDLKSGLKSGVDPNAILNTGFFDNYLTNDINYLLENG